MISNCEGKNCSQNFLINIGTIYVIIQSVPCVSRQPSFFTLNVCQIPLSAKIKSSFQKALRQEKWAPAKEYIQKNEYCKNFSHGLARVSNLIIRNLKAPNKKIRKPKQNGSVEYRTAMVSQLFVSRQPCRNYPGIIAQRTGRSLLFDKGPCLDNEQNFWNWKVASCLMED